MTPRPSDPTPTPVWDPARTASPGRARASTPSTWARNPSTTAGGARTETVWPWCPTARSTSSAADRIPPLVVPVSSIRQGMTATAGSSCSSTSAAFLQGQELVAQGTAVRDAPRLELRAGQRAVGYGGDRRPQAERLLQLTGDGGDEFLAPLHLDPELVERPDPHHLDPELAFAAAGPNGLL